MKFPQNPTVARDRNLLNEVIFRMWGIAKGRRTREARSMRSDPTWAEVKIWLPLDVNMPFFMRMNELPHMHARMSSRIQLRISLVMLQRYKNSWSTVEASVDKLFKRC